MTDYIILDLKQVDPDKTLREIINERLTHSNKNNISQMKLDSDKDVKPRKYFCNNPDCKKEITKEVVAFCLHKDNKDRFKGKVYCRECQEDR